MGKLYWYSLNIKKRNQQQQSSSIVRCMLFCLQKSIVILINCYFLSTTLCALCISTANKTNSVNCERHQTVRSHLRLQLPCFSYHIFQCYNHHHYITMIELFIFIFISNYLFFDLFSLINNCNTT